MRIWDCGLRPGGAIGAYAPEGLRIGRAESRGHGAERKEDGEKVGG